jgi:hypothetical protein
MAWVTDPQGWIALLTLTVLEIVLSACHLSRKVSISTSRKDICVLRWRSRSLWKCLISGCGDAAHNHFISGARDSRKRVEGRVSFGKFFAYLREGAYREHGRSDRWGRFEYFWGS